MKKLGFLLIILSFSIIFGACPPLEEDDQDSVYAGNVISFNEPFELDVYKWFEILDKIAKERRYVSLDLSKGTYKEGNTSGGLIETTIKEDPIFSEKYIAFDPFPATISGKNYILSIILPNEAQMINQATEDDKIISDKEEEIENTKKYSAFRAFPNLRSVKADNVTLIGNFAFADCTSLNEVIFPRVGHEVSIAELSDDNNSMINGYRRDIGKHAFMGCTNLKDVKFNSAAVIGEYAFNGCTSLSKIDFPEVWNIERNAFEGCESLVNVFFEKASKVGEEAFKNCSGLKKAEFNVNPDRFLPGDPDPIPLPVNTPLPATPITASYDSVIFYPSVFNGCKALEILNVRRAWNVYFSKDVLANTGSAIEIYLFDKPSAGTQYCHPQNARFLGEGATATLKKVTILVPTGGELIQENSASDNIAKFIRKFYTSIDVNVNKRTF